MKELEVSWETIKNIKTRDGLTLYYISFAQVTDPVVYEYEIIATNQKFVYKTRVFGGDVADFEANFKTSAISVSSYEDAIACSVPAISSDYIPEQLWLATRLTTTSTAKGIILTTTVPANKDLYLISHSIARITDNRIDAIPATLEIVLSGTSTVVAKRERCLMADLGCVWEITYPIPIQIATAGDVVRLTITPSGSSPTIWSGTLIAVLRSI